MGNKKERKKYLTWRSAGKRIASQMVNKTRSFLFFFVIEKRQVYCLIKDFGCFPIDRKH